MRLADFDYELPPDRIAQTPIEPRDAARLLVVNETRVLPARLRLQRASGGAAEVLLLEPLDGGRRTWEALVRPARKLRSGETLFASDGSPVVEVGGRTEAGDTFRVALIGSVESLDLLDTHGEMPLPPYITQRLDDAERYQTVYARLPGSAAAPTAGLHFTPELFERLDAAGVAVARVELVVGLDTFRPIATDDPLQHRIHTERYRVPGDTLERCRASERVVAVGTTSVRALESAATTGELEGRTDIFIHRGYDWQVVDVLMTNFHLPCSTLFMLVAAFAGLEIMKMAYAHAIAEGYRFYSYGDASLLFRA